MGSGRSHIIFFFEFYFLNHFIEVLLTYQRLYISNVYNLMSWLNSTPVKPSSQSKYIHHLQNFPPTLFIYCHYLCVWEHLTKELPFWQIFKYTILFSYYKVSGVPPYSLFYSLVQGHSENLIKFLCYSLA